MKYDHKQRPFVLFDGPQHAVTQEKLMTLNYKAEHNGMLMCIVVFIFTPTHTHATIGPKKSSVVSITLECTDLQ